MTDKTTAIKKAQADTIQVHPDATKGEGVNRFAWVQSRGPLLPEYGSRSRERALNLLYLFDYNWMPRSAFTGLMKKVAATPWEITGPDDISTGAKAWYYKQVGSLESDRPDIEYWQELLRQANFGAGWADFIKMGVDYLKQDAGWYWEIIAPGNPQEAPTGAVTGLAHLDSLRCIPTGDPTYPVLYINEKNIYHLLHHTRVVHMVDMPSGDITRRGYGMCALSRAVVIANREINMGRYIDTFLDDKPPPGVVIASGMVKQERDYALARFKDEQRVDEKAAWGNQLWFFAADATQAASLTFQSFAQAPEKFNFKEYTDIDINSLALALGVDIQELWQLSGGNIGSATQSEVLHRKGQGRAIGDLYANIERAINDILPVDYNFEFKYKDENEDKDRAELARIWTDVVNNAGANLSEDEARRVLANQVEGIHDAITDEEGEIIRVDDLDVQPEEAPPTIIQVVEEAKPEATNGKVPPQFKSKEFAATREQFIEKVGDFIGTFILDQNRARFGIAMRRYLRQSGEKAMLDGLETGGVIQTTLDADEKKLLALWIAQQSRFITDLGQRVKDGENVNANSSAEMWANKSLQVMYNAGLLSADGNGMYEWNLGATEEHCKTCLRLNGQVHRFKDWVRTDLIPKSSKLECGGWRCDCALEKTTGRAKGRF